MRRIGKQIPRVLALALLMVDNAHANNGPGPGLAFGPFLLIFLLILLSTAGGAYPILAHLDPNRNRWWRHAVRWAGAIGIILSAFVLPGVVDDVLALIGILAGLLVLLYLWLRRSIEMLWWANQARSANPKPAHLTTANPKRLFFAGTALIVLSILTMGYLWNLGSSGPSKLARAASDAKTAVTQGMVYTNDTGAYPTSFRVLREKGYANIADTDPWRNAWILAPVLTEGRKPQQGDDVYVYSKGPCGTGTYQPGKTDTGKCGSIGYSTIHGSFQGQDK